jgi:hypothetical protein
VWPLRSVMPGRRPDMSAAAIGLRTWAMGDFAQEAGVELLIRALDGRFAFRGVSVGAAV